MGINKEQTMHTQEQQITAIYPNICSQDLLVFSDLNKVYPHIAKVFDFRNIAWLCLVTEVWNIKKLC